MNKLNNVAREYNNNKLHINFVEKTQNVDAKLLKSASRYFDDIQKEYSLVVTRLTEVSHQSPDSLIDARTHVEQILISDKYNAIFGKIAINIQSDMKDKLMQIFKKEYALNKHISTIPIYYNMEKCQIEDQMPVRAYSMIDRVQNLFLKDANDLKSQLSFDGQG